MPTHNFDSDVTLLHPTLIPPKSWGVAGEALSNYLYNHAPDLVEITNESVDENISSQCMQDHTPTADPDARHDDDSVDNTGPGSEADLCDSSQNPPGRTPTRASVPGKSGSATLPASAPEFVPDAAAHTALHGPDAAEHTDLAGSIEARGSVA
jgi:hypothetical protein